VSLPRCPHALILYLLLTPLVLASHPPESQGILVLDIENDWFAGTDRHYTSGLRLTRVRPADAGPPWLLELAESLPMYSDEARLGITTAIGQNVYTPVNPKALPPDPQDRPYAGWLYGTAGLDMLSERYLDRLHLTLGVVGPASLADRTQRAIHAVTGPEWPRGWDYQLGNEATLMLSYERQWRALEQGIGQGGWETDLTPHAGFSIGTPFSFINGGFMIRVGKDLPMDYGPPRIQPGLTGSGLFESRPGRHSYGFVGIDLRLVGLDLFLDGNTWRDSPGVHRERQVGDLYLGLALGFEHLRVSYTHVLRSQEFRTQDGRQSFGALSFSWIQ